jgi:hypothetical protein
VIVDVGRGMFGLRRVLHEVAMTDTEYSTNVQSGAHELPQELWAGLAIIGVIAFALSKSFVAWLEDLDRKHHRGSAFSRLSKTSRVEKISHSSSQDSRCERICQEAYGAPYRPRAAGSEVSPDSR